MNGAIGMWTPEDIERRMDGLKARAQAFDVVPSRTFITPPKPSPKRSAMSVTR